MNGGEFEAIPDNKCAIIKIESFGDDWCVNDAISNEYQVGWIVQQIIYLEHIHSILILFKRKDT